MWRIGLRKLDTDCDTTDAASTNVYTTDAATSTTSSDLYTGFDSVHPTTGSGLYSASGTTQAETDASPRTVCATNTARLARGTKTNSDLCSCAAAEYAAQT